MTNWLSVSDSWDLFSSKLYHREQDCQREAREEQDQGNLHHTRLELDKLEALGL